MSHEAGKGSGQRPPSKPGNYQSNFDAIFGKVWVRPSAVSWPPVADGFVIAVTVEKDKLQAANDGVELQPTV